MPKNPCCRPFLTKQAITVLTLAGEAYAEAGAYQRGSTAASALLAGFAVPVAALLDAK